MEQVSTNTNNYSFAEEQAVNSLHRILTSKKYAGKEKAKYFEGVLLKHSEWVLENISIISTQNLLLLDEDLHHESGPIRNELNRRGELSSDKPAK